MPTSRYTVIDDRVPHFMTSSVVDWLPVFRIRPCIEVILNSLSSFLRAQGDLRLHAYVVMEDHVHLVGSSPRLAHVMKRFLSYTARHIIHYLAEARSEYLPIFRLHCHDRRRAHRLQDVATRFSSPGHLLSADAGSENGLHHQ